MHGHIQHINISLADGQLFPLTVIREDLNQPLLQGNKFWKLKHNISAAKQNGHTQLLTYGGAYSNHIHATAIAGKIHGIKTIGIIHGEEPKIYSPTLRFAQELGMVLYFVSRELYRQKGTPAFYDMLFRQFGHFFEIPEGGANQLGLQGCMEWGYEMANTADVYCLAAGTATSAAGIAKFLLSAQPDAEVWAFSALKNGHFLKEDAEKISATTLPNLHIITDYHFGGYAKYNNTLLNFIQEVEARYNIPLEQVYTGKTLYGLIDLANKNTLNFSKRYCFIHTGGLQGKLASN